MGAPLEGYLIGDGDITARLRALGPRLKEELRAGIGRATLKLQRRVVGKLDGEVLKVRTGRLRRSIGQLVETQGDKVVGVVSTNVRYAPPNEFGFGGTVNVRQHLRTIKQAFGRPISPRQVEVRAHSAHMNLPERSFLRSALRELEASGAIREEIEAAIGRAAA